MDVRGGGGGERGGGGGGEGGGKRVKVGMRKVRGGTSLVDVVRLEL